MQGNPIQPDLNYRGYTASPLLGTPQGISVYMDGVRLNQPFGDVVSWDLIPRIAISETTLIPGSNPLFGLNTLGGAISIQTKDGRSDPGTSLAIERREFRTQDRRIRARRLELERTELVPGEQPAFEDGWRESSPSNVRQFFGNVGWQGSKTVLGLTVAYANNSLIGNGLQEQRFLARDYTSVYTKPDITANRLPFVNLRRASQPEQQADILRQRLLPLHPHQHAERRYQRRLARSGGLPAERRGARGLDCSGIHRISACRRERRQHALPVLALHRAISAARRTGREMQWPSESLQHEAAQLRLVRADELVRLAGRQRNQFTAGAAYDRNKVDFVQSTQLGYLNPDRSVTGVASFADGVTGGDEDGVPFDTRVDLNGPINTGSVYATDTLSFRNAWNVALSGRYNRTTIRQSTTASGPSPVPAHSPATMCSTDSTPPPA